MPRLPIILSVVVVVGLLAATAWFIDPLILGSLSLYLMVASAVAAVVCLIMSLGGDLKGERRPGAVRWLWRCVTLVLVLATTIKVNQWAFHRHVEEAKAFPSRAMAHLESYRQQHGEYPPNLAHLPPGTRVPRLLRGGYRPDGRRYSFIFAKPGTLMGGWVFDSTTKSWTESF